MLRVGTAMVMLRECLRGTNGETSPPEILPGVIISGGEMIHQSA